MVTANHRSSKPAGSAQLNPVFMASVVHDMKTPLTLIAGATYFLQNETNLSPDEPDFWLRDIVGQTKRIDAMLHDLLDTI